MNNSKKIRGLGTLLATVLLFVPVLSFADLSTTLQLLSQTRDLERASTPYIASNPTLKEGIDLIYQSIIESLTVELDLLIHPATKSIVFDQVPSQLSKNSVVTVSFSRTPKESSSPIDFGIETGGHTVGSLSNQVTSNSFKWQVANNFLAGRQYIIVAKDKEGKTLASSNAFTVSLEITSPPMTIQPTVTPVQPPSSQPAATPTIVTYPAPDINSGVLGYWSFDNNANNCSTKGGATTNTEGKIGYALGLGGTNPYCVVSTARSFYPSQFSIDLWAKSDELHKDAWVGSNWFVSLRDGAGYKIGPIGGTKKVQFTILDNTDSASASYNAGVVEPLNISDWHNYAVTYDGNIASVYLDGELATSTSLGIIRGFAGSADLQFGSDNAPENQQYGLGALDEIRLYKRAITPCEVKVLAGKVCQGYTLDNSGNQIASVFSVINKIIGGNQ